MLHMAHQENIYIIRKAYIDSSEMNTHTKKKIKIYIFGHHEDKHSGNVKKTYVNVVWWKYFLGKLI